MAASLPVAIGRRDVVAQLRFDEALGSAAHYADAEQSAGTRRAYASDMRQFEVWCRAIDASALPASIATVAAYLASLADAGRKASTINRRCAAIADRHRRAGLEPPTNAEQVKAVCRGIRRTIGTRVDQKAPVTAKVLTSMLRAVPDNLSGRRDRALLLIGFAAALRRSELVALQVDDIERMPEGILVHIRRSKTDQDGAGAAVPVPRGSKLRAVDALEAWLTSAGITSGPIFRAIGKGGAVGAAALSDRSVADIVKRWVATAKLDANLFSGHSLRSGLVTTALEHGADMFKITAITRHRSIETLKKYDRRANAFQQHAGAKFL